MTNVKIFTIPGWYKTTKNKEACIFIYEQMQALKRLDNEIIILSVQPQRKFNNMRIDYYDDTGIKTYYGYSLGLWPSKLKFNWLYFYEKSLEKVFKKAVEDNGKPDIIYAHFSYPAGYAAIKLGKKYKLPVVIQEHFSGLMNNKIDLQLKKILKKCVNSADEFICVSDGLKENILRHVDISKEIRVISNMINNCFNYIKPIEHNEFIFSSIGSLINRKGFDLLIKAFSDEFANDKNVRLDIAGSGPEEVNLKKLINDNKMENRIRLLGQLSRAETLNLYSNSDCFVLASKAETYGLVYREALAVGRPIISTKHGGFTKNDWHNEYGILIDIDSYDQLKRAMRKIYNDYSKYDLEKISDICLRDCSEKSVIVQIDTVLKNSKERKK